MKVFFTAALCTALLSGTAWAGSTANHAKHQARHHASHYATYHRHHHVTANGYYKPGIPRHDPGRYSNLPGKDAAYSKAWIRDH